MNGGMERAQRLTQVRGAAVFLFPFLLFFFSVGYARATGLYLSIFHLSSFIFHLSAGTKGSGWELRHLAGSPGGGGVIRLCHTLVRVNTV